MSYDIAVVGAGSAGFSAAITAAELGAKVALIGAGVLGGTCVNVGCVPSKALIRATESLHQARAAQRFAGIRASAEVTDWQALIGQKDELVASLRQAKYADLLPEYEGITYREGAARLTENGVTIDGDPIAAGKIILASGARAAIPDIAGIDQVSYLTSTTALELDKLPKSLLIIGGGYIGCELAQMFARAGVTVTIVSRRGLLPEGEPEISTALSRYFSDEAINVVSGVVYHGLQQTGSSIALSLSRAGKPALLTAERVLLATGRTANVEGFGLAEIGIELTEKGGIRIDAHMQTTRPGIYAAGDVTGRDAFVYMAAYGAKIAATNAIGGNSMVYDNSVMPAVVFTDPQIASVGLTERQARAAGHEVKTSLLPLDHVPRALAARDTRGLIKLVADAKTDRLIGAHILAPEGADSIQTAALAIRYKMSVQDLGATIFPYLTNVEGLKLAAQTFDKDVGMLSCCAG